MYMLQTSVRVKNIRRARKCILYESYRYHNISYHSGPGAGPKTVKRRMRDSPHRSGDYPTTAWCGARLRVLKHPHCGHSRVRGRFRDRIGRLCARVRGLVVTVKPLQRRISDSPHRSSDGHTTPWCVASLTVLKRSHCGHSHASVVKYP